MDRTATAPMYADKNYRMRTIRNLVEQIRRDHELLHEISIRGHGNAVRETDGADSERFTSWLRKEMTLLKELAAGEIEGPLLPEIDDIEKGMKNKPSDS